MFEFETQFILTDVFVQFGGLRNFEPDFTQDILKAIARLFPIGLISLTKHL